jgi:hypothetical protein
MRFAVLDPLSPLFQAHSTAHATVAVDMMPNATNPASAQGVMIVGIIIIVATALWVVGALSAAVCVRLNRARDRGFAGRR